MKTDSQLDGLCGNVEMTVNNLYARADEQFRQLLGEEYTGGYYRAMYDLQTRLGYSGQFSTISREMVENTLAYPWSGANFSDRLWKNKTALVDTIRETLTQGMIRGDNIRDMSRAVADKLNSSYRSAERLVRTETSHIHNTAEIAAYEAAGYEEYEFLASFGERTCEVCGGLDGQHFKLADIQYGVNFPPVHPNCRCTTVGYDPEEKELPEGEQEKLSYEEWYGNYVEGREQEQITEHQTAPALIAPTVDGREVVLTGSGDFLAFRHVDGLTDEQVGDIINSRRATRIPGNRPNWQHFSLAETILRLAPGAISRPITHKGKIEYYSPSSPYEVVYDSVFDYFRVVDTRIKGTKNVYVDINGNKADNYTDSFGKQHGRLRSDYQQFTHYDNIDYRKEGDNT